MKNFGVIELISRFLILVTIGTQFLILQPLNEKFSNDQFQSLEQSIKNNQNIMSSIKDLLSTYEKSDNPESEINISEEEVVIALKAIANAKSCSKLVLGEERTNNFINKAGEKVTVDSLIEYAFVAASEMSPEEFDSFADCFLGRYSEEVIDVITSFQAIYQEIGDAIIGGAIEEKIVKPLAVRLYAVFSWVNFIFFLLGTALAIWARKIELSHIENSGIRSA